MNTTGNSKLTSMSPQFLVTHLEQSITFYTQLLGFNLDFRYKDFYAGVSRDGFSLHLKTGNPNQAERQSKRINEDLDIQFGVSGIQDLYKDISAKTIDVIQPLREMPYGREFYISDPDGYILGFIEAKRENIANP